MVAKRHGDLFQVWSKQAILRDGAKLGKARTAQPREQAPKLRDVR